MKELIPYSGPKKPDIKKYVIAGIIILVIFFGAFGFWAALAPLHAGAIAPGHIVAQSNRKTIQHLEGGIIEKIYVNDGDKVKIGEPLIELERTSFKANVDLISGEYYSALAKEARLIAERDNSEKITFPESVLKYSDIQERDKILQGQEGIFKTNQSSFNALIETFKQQTVIAKREIEALKGQIASEQRAVQYSTQEIDAYEKLAARHLVEKSKLWILKTARAKIEAEINEREKEIAQAEQRIAESQLKIVQETNKKFQTAVNDLRDTQREIAQISQRLKAAHDQLKRTKITAPIDGTIVNLQYHTVGGVIEAGKPILDIVPIHDELIIEARIKPNDIDVVHPGLPARVKLTAYSSRYTPTLHGKVIYISADALTDSKTGENYFVAKVKIDTNELKKLTNVSLYPGMPAEVMIISERRTFLDYIITPIKHSFERAFHEE